MASWAVAAASGEMASNGHSYPTGDQRKVGGMLPVLAPLVLLAVVVLATVLVLRWGRREVAPVEANGHVVSYEHRPDGYFYAACSCGWVTGQCGFEDAAARAGRLHEAPFLPLSERFKRAGADAAAAERRRRAAPTAAAGRAGGRVRAPISVVGRQEGGGLACPKCGGVSFKGRRSKTARVGIVGASVVTGGLAGLAGVAVTRQKQVTCVTCGTRYDRG